MEKNITIKDGISYQGFLDKCNICGTEISLIEHHISYDPEIRQILCKSCHMRFHKKNPDIKRPENYKSKGKALYTTITVKQAMKRKMEDYWDELGIQNLPRGSSWTDFINLLIKDSKDYRIMKERYKLR